MSNDEREFLILAHSIIYSTTYKLLQEKYPNPAEVYNDVPLRSRLHSEIWNALTRSRMGVYNDASWELYCNADNNPSLQFLCIEFFPIFLKQLAYHKLEILIDLDYYRLNALIKNTSTVNYKRGWA